MLNNRRNSLNLLALATVTTMLAACGGGGGSAPFGTAPGAPLSGKAVDFYLSGATVTYLDCGNKTSLTGTDGSFTAPAGCLSSAIVVTGGIDTGTNKAFTGVLKTPKQAIGSRTDVIVSPLTTLIATNPALAAKIAAQFGLGGLDPLTTDPLTNAAALKASLVVQTLLDQVTLSLKNASTANGGTLTQAQATDAALQALASQLASSPSSAFDLTNSTNLQAIVATAATNAGDALKLPAGATAASFAATATPSITNQVSAVSTAVANIVVGSSPDATLAALKAGGVTDAVASAQTSTSTTLTNYVQLGNVSFNGGVAKTLADLQASTATAPIALQSGSALTDVHVSLNGVGTYANKTVPVNAGLKYAIGANVVNVVINNVQLTFNADGKLTAATVPVGSSYTFSLAGASTASATLTNSTVDNLFSNSGVNLSISTFLSKLSAAASLNTQALNAYTPKAGDLVTATLAIGAGTNTALVVGDTAGHTVAAASVGTVSGSGVTANIK